MSTPETRRARGIVRRASLISPPINDADSAPLNAESRVDQTAIVPQCSEGFIDAAEKLVAAPNLIHAIPPAAHNRATGSHVPIAPRLLSHLPISRPTMLRAKASPRPSSENAMKNPALPCNRSEERRAGKEG